MKTYFIRLERGYNASIPALLKGAGINYTDGLPSPNGRPFRLSCSAEEAERIAQIPGLIISENAQTGARQPFGIDVP